MHFPLPAAYPSGGKAETATAGAGARQLGQKLVVVRLVRARSVVVPPVLG